MKGNNTTGPQNGDGFWAAVLNRINSGLFIALDSAINLLEKIEKYQDTLHPDYLDFERPAQDYQYVRLREELYETSGKRPGGAEPAAKEVQHPKTPMPPEDRETSPTRSPRKDSSPAPDGATSIAEEPAASDPFDYQYVPLREELYETSGKRPGGAEPAAKEVQHPKTPMPPEDRATSPLHSPRSPREDNSPAPDGATSIAEEPTAPDPFVAAFLKDLKDSDNASIIATLSTPHFRCMNNAMFSEDGLKKFEHFLTINPDFRTTVTDFSGGLEKILKKGDGTLVPEYATAMYEFTIKRQDMPELTGQPNDMKLMRSLLEKNPEVAEYLTDNLPRLQAGAKDFEAFYNQTLKAEKNSSKNTSALYSKSTSHVERLQQESDKGKGR